MAKEKDTQDIISQIARHYEEILRLLGEDTTREGLVKTPVRAAKALYYCTQGYRQTVEEVVGDAIFTHEGSDMITVQDIEFYSFCEHHILPFFGSVSVGYIPDGKIIGISKLARLVNLYARRLQIQERFTREICEAVRDVLGARGVIVVCNAGHLCMKMRGVEKQDATTTTLATTGLFDDPSLLHRFLLTLKK